MNSLSFSTGLFGRNRALALRSILWVLSLCSFAVVSMPAPANPVQERQIVKVGYTEFAPLTYQNSRKEAAGEFIEITRKVVIEAGYNPVFQYLPPSRLTLYLSTGDIDLAPYGSRSPPLRNTTLESWISPVSLKLSVWHLDTTERPEHFNTVAGKRVIVVRGYTYGGLLDYMISNGNISLTEAPDHRAAIDMLKLDRGDYLLAFNFPVEVLLEPAKDANVRATGVSSVDGVLLYSLSNPRAAVLREELDDAYIRLSEKGEVPPPQRIDIRLDIPGFPDL